MNNNEILDYIESKEHLGALLITGKWGSGKSFSVRQIVDAVNKEDKYALLMISVFGLSNVDEIERLAKKQLLTSSFSEKDNNLVEIGTKGFSFLKSLLGILQDYSKILKGINAALNIDFIDLFPIKADLPNGKKLVLIFDDFERTNCNVSDLLGFINQLIEIKHIPIILIADESKINDGLYYDFKEKVVFRTLYLEPDSHSAISSIVSNHPASVDGYLDFIYACQNDSITIFDESNTLNLRTFKSIIHDFERVYRICITLDIPLTTIQSLFYVFSCCAYELKAKRYVDSEKYGRLYKNLQKKSNSLTAYYTDYSYRFAHDKEEDQSDYSKIEEVSYSLFDPAYKLLSLDEWLNNGKWEEQSLVEELKRKYKEVEQGNYNFLNCDYLKLNDQMIKDQLPDILQKAYSGELTREELIQLLSRILFLTDIQSPFPCEIDYDKMNDGYSLREERIRDGIVEEVYGNLFIEDDRIAKLGEKGKAFYNRLDENDSRLVSWKTRKAFLNWLKTPETYFSHSAYGRALVSFDDDLYQQFLTVFLNADSAIKRNMIDMLIHLDFSYERVSDRNDIEKTIENLQKMKSNIDELSETKTDSIELFVLKEGGSAIRSKIVDLQNKISN